MNFWGLAYVATASNLDYQTELWPVALLLTWFNFNPSMDK